MPNYGDPKYWDKRYEDQEDTTFDWLEDWSSLKDLITAQIRKDSKILILGCGNAEFSEDMYDAGYLDLHNIDISNVVIDQMKKRNEERPKMKWEVMDITDLKYESDTFDMAIDKSTIDALLCGDNAFLNVAKMTKEVQRVLKPGALYFVVSYGRPENRTFHFEREHLDFDTKQYVLYPDNCKGEEEKNDKSHFVYICTKGKNANECHKNWNKIREQLEKEAKEEEQLAASDDSDEDKKDKKVKEVIEAKEDKKDQKEDKTDNNKSVF
jgi:SAM-dependent methyltransferase